MKALVLDDEQDYREHLKHSLERKGIQAYSAGTAPEARDILSQSPVDLLIVDIKLANSINGLEFADWAKTRKPDLVLIVITGYSSPEYEQRSYELGALAYLEKPFDLTRLDLHVQAARNRRDLLREVHRLEQELAAASERTGAAQAAEVWPLTCLSATGDILFATDTGRAALDSVSDPSRPRPLERVDEALLFVLRNAVATDERRACVRICRRDGSLADYMGLVSVTRWQESSALSLLLIDPQRDLSLMLDDPWTTVLSHMLEAPCNTADGVR